jgi:hypothetical protein
LYGSGSDKTGKIENYKGAYLGRELLLSKDGEGGISILPKFKTIFRLIGRF